MPLHNSSWLFFLFPSWKRPQWQTDKWAHPFPTHPGSTAAVYRRATGWWRRESGWNLSLNASHSQPELYTSVVSSIAADAPLLPSSGRAPNNPNQALPLVSHSPSHQSSNSPATSSASTFPFRRWSSRSKSAVKVKIKDCRTAGDRRHARFTVSDICQKEVFNYNAPGLDRGKTKK